jgi:hypothetical protein
MQVDFIEGALPSFEIDGLMIRKLIGETELMDP